jgi:flagellin
MTINTNLSSLDAATYLSQATQRLSQSLARLSSGSKIVSPADDAAGLAVSMNLNAQINRTDAANNNISNAISFSQTQDGYLANATNALDRMSELTIQAQDVTKSDSDRALYNKEFQTLATYVRNVQTEQFNGVSLFSGNALKVTTDSEGDTFSMAGMSADYLSGTANSSNTPLSNFTSVFASNPGTDLFVGNSAISVQDFKTLNSSSTIQDVVDFLNSTGSNTSASYDSTSGQLTLSVAANSVIYDYVGGLKSMGFTPTAPSPSPSGGDPDVYGSTSATTFTATLAPASSGSLDISTVQDAASALKTIKSAISQVATDRATIGANMEELNQTAGQLNTLRNNLSAANSVITDVDVAAESTNYARQNILVQVGTAMLSQSNVLPNYALRLLS